MDRSVPLPDKVEERLVSPSRSYHEGYQERETHHTSNPNRNGNIGRSDLTDCDRSP